MRALVAGCLLLAVAFAVDLAALFLGGFGSFDDSLHASLLSAAAYSIAVLSLVYFARAVPPQQGRLARRAALVFWLMIGATAVFYALAIVAAYTALDFGGQTWGSLSDLAVLAALGWAVGVRPLGSRVARLGAALAAVGCIVSLAVALALSWGSFEDLSRGGVPWFLASLLAFSAAALSLGARRDYPQSS